MPWLPHSHADQGKLYDANRVALAGLVTLEEGSTYVYEVDVGAGGDIGKGDRLLLQIVPRDANDAAVPASSRLADLDRMNLASAHDQTVVLGDGKATFHFVFENPGRFSGAVRIGARHIANGYIDGMAVGGLVAEVCAPVAQ